MLEGILRPEDIPRCYGGVDDTPLGQKDDDVAMVAYAHELAERNGPSAIVEPRDSALRGVELVLSGGSHGSRMAAPGASRLLSMAQPGSSSSSSRGGTDPGDGRGAYAAISSVIGQGEKSADSYFEESEDEEFFDPEAGVTFVNTNRDSSHYSSGGVCSGSLWAKWVTSARQLVGYAFIRAFCCCGAVLCYVASFPPKQMAKAVLIIGASCTIAYWCVEDMSAWVPAPWRCLLRKGTC